MRKTIKNNKCVHDDYSVMMDIFVKHLLEKDALIDMRCALEGCRYGYEIIDKIKKDKCIYCGQPGR